MTRYIDLSGDSRFDMQIGNRGKRSKYGNKKTIVDGITFDSLHEANRYRELKLLERGKVIRDLKRQVSFELLPAQKWHGKTAERPVSYIADFTYIDRATDEFIVEDAKGMRTKEYILKRKMMLYFHGIRIREV